MLGEDRSMVTQSTPTVGMVTWGYLFDEDFLDTLGVSFDTFRDQFVGSWMFGYIDALQQAGVRTVVFCTSARVNAPLRFIHEPTGAKVCVLPAPQAYRSIRRKMIKPYGMAIDEVFGDVQGARRTLFTALKEVAPYLATPLSLLARELRREGCNSILCQSYDYARFDSLVLLGKLLRLPVFATFQSGEDRLLGSIERIVRPRTLQACDGLIVGSRAEAKRIRLRYQVPYTKLARIFNPIDLKAWQAVDRGNARATLGIPNGARVAVWHGRVEIGQKGLDILLEAWGKVCRTRPGKDLRLLLIGSGNDAKELRQLIDAYQLSGVMWIDHFVHDRALLRTYLSAADVYSMPSRGEAFPVAPIEAMACGLPVVAADANGIPDILGGGDASGGLIVPSNDSEALAMALGQILDNEQWSRELGRKARNRVEASFSLDVVGRQLRSFLMNEWQQRNGVPVSGDYLYRGVSIEGEPPLTLRSISPTETRVNTGFNLWMGNSILAITAENTCRGTLVAMGKDLLVTTYRNSSELVAFVPQKVLRRPGRYPVCLTDGVRHSNQMEFIVGTDR